MFPQTHVHFAQRVLGSITDAAALGSIFPDMIISPAIGHKQAHSLGEILMKSTGGGSEWRDFTRGVITHGIKPCGLDFYGDEKYPGYSRGYCFEKARPLVKQTTEACNIPHHMGWWKAHNIVEMGIELHISGNGQYGEMISKACGNEQLVRHISEKLTSIIPQNTSFLWHRVSNFPHYIEVHRVTPERLARKYNVQMRNRHGVNIDTTKVAKLISKAAEIISDDIEDFFDLVEQKITSTLKF